jgi:D-glycero-D-manno-heptose 1,7-bisphosphate phosphatase
MAAGGGRQMRRAVFLDRDGTINVEKDYLHRVEDFEFIPGVPEAIARLNGAGFLVIVVTNQSGVARGFYDLEAVHALHAHIAESLAPVGAVIDAWYVCPHHPENGVDEYRCDCLCRKPLPGMLLEAAEHYDIDLASSFMVGDKLADVDAALAAGSTPLLVRTGYGADAEKNLPAKVAVVDDLPAAVEMIVALSGRY